MSGYRILRIMFLVALLLSLVNCSRSKEELRRGDVKTVGLSRLFDTPQDIENMIPILDEMLKSEIGLDCNKVFTSSPFEEIARLRLADNDTLAIMIDVNELGLRRFSIIAMDNMQEICFTPKYGTDTVMVKKNVFFKRLDLNKEWKRIQRFSLRNSYLASMLIYAIVDSGKFVELRSICSKWPNEDYSLDDFIRFRGSRRIHLANRAERLIDSCFEVVDDYKIYVDKDTTIYTVPIPKDSIDSLLDSELGKMPVARALGVKYRYSDGSLKDYVQDFDTVRFILGQSYKVAHLLSLYSMEGASDKESKRIRYIDGYSKFEILEEEDEADFIEDELMSEFKSVSGFDKDMLNFEVRYVFEVRNGYIHEMKHMDNLTIGARKYYEAIAKE